MISSADFVQTYGLGLSLPVAVMISDRQSVCCWSLSVPDPCVVEVLDLGLGLVTVVGSVVGVIWAVGAIKVIQVGVVGGWGVVPPGAHSPIPTPKPRLR